MATYNIEGGQVEPKAAAIALRKHCPVQNNQPCHFLIQDHPEKPPLSLLSHVCCEILHQRGHEISLPVLLPPLESLAKREKTKVRTEAVMSLKSLAAICEQPLTVESHFVPLVERLSSEKSVASRLSACDLLCACYQRVSKTCQCKLQHYKDLVVSMKWAESVQIESTDASMVELYADLASDEEESVRVLAVEYGIALPPALAEHKISKTQFRKTFLNPTVENSWKVRAKIAQRFAKAPKWLFEPEIGTEVVDAYKTFLGDEQFEVRSQAASKLKDVCDKFSEEQQKEFVLGVISAMRSFECDSKEKLKGKLAVFTMSMTSVLGKQKTIDELLPVLEVLLKDKDVNVALEVISNWDAVAKALGGWEQLAQNLSADTCDLAKNITLLLMVDSKTFEGKLKPLFMVWLSSNETIWRRTVDSFKILAGQCREVFDWMRQSAKYVERVAKAAISHPLIELAKSINEVLKKNPLPTTRTSAVFSLIKELLNELAKDQNPQIKLRALFFVNELAEVISNDTQIKYLFSAVEDLAKDDDPAVRCELCKTIHRLSRQKNYLNPKLSGDASDVKQRLDGLEKDGDPDVQKAAKEAVVALFGTFRYKSFALTDKDDESIQSTLLLLKLRHCFDVVTPLLHSLTKSVMSPLYHEFKEKFVEEPLSQDKKPNWDDLVRFIVKTNVMTSIDCSEKKKTEQIERNMKRSLKDLGERVDYIPEDDMAQVFVEAVTKPKAFLILYLYVNDLYDDPRQMATEANATDLKPCLEFLKTTRLTGNQAKTGKDGIPLWKI
eukprot:m.273097 g.273097  ORF g.273097 m.273097 type:complete len:780 (+) comp40570_c0_seq50:479-2818(+)